MINFKNRGLRSKLSHWKKTMYSYVSITSLNKKITLHVDMIDIQTGYEKIGNLHCILKTIFHCKDGIRTVVEKCFAF